MPENHVTEGQFVEYIQEAATQMNKIDDKINQVEKITGFNQKGNVATYADLATIENPQVNDAYGVIADGLTYVYNGNSFPTEGNGMDLRIKPDGVIEEGNTQAVSGGEVFNYIDNNDNYIANLSVVETENINFGNSLTFPNSAGVNLNNYIWASKKHFISLNTKKINNITLGLNNNDIEGNFEVYFVKVFSNNIPPVFISKKVFTSVPKVGNDCILDLSDINVNDVLGCYVFVKSNNSLSAFTFETSGAETISINLDNNTISLDIYDFDFTLNVDMFNQENKVDKSIIASLSTNENKINPPNFDLQDYINKNRYVFLLPQTYEISQPLTIPNGTVISSIFGGAILKAKDISVKEVISLSSPEFITLNNLILEGVSFTKPNLVGLSQFKWKWLQGDKTGLYITGSCKNITISNCLFRSFDKSGFTIYNSFTQKNGLKLINVSANDNYIGYDFGERSEYTSAVNISANDNVIGGYISSGNNMFSNAHFDVNQCGLVLSGTANNNDSHGSFATSTFNHNTQFSIISTEITFGYTFVGCHAFDGDMWIDDSIGFNFNSGIIACKITIDKGTELKDGANSFQSNCFFKDYGGGDIVVNTLKVPILKGNFFADGSNSDSLNN